MQASVFIFKRFQNACGKDGMTKQKGRMRMRKKWTAFLCALLCMALFAGCSPAETGYLKMSREMVETMEKSEIKGTVDIIVNFDELKAMAAKTAAEMGASKEGIDEALADMKDLAGKKQATIDYTMQMQLEPLEYVINAVVNYDGEKYPLGNLYFSMEKGMYISTEAVMSYYRILGEVTGKTDSFLYKNPEFVKEWKALLDNTGYILVASPEEMGLGATADADALTQMDKLIDAALNMYEKGFSGFTTGMVSEIAGGYHISANGAQMKAMLLNMIQYTSDNPTQVLDAVKGYLENVLEFTGDLQESQDLADTFEELKENPEEVKRTLVQLKEMAKALLEQKAVSIWLDGFSYEADAVKKDAGYEAREQYVLKNGSNVALQFNTKQAVRKIDKGMTFPAARVSIDEFIEKAESLLEKYNPVEGVSVVWHPAEAEEMAVVSVIRAEDFPMLDGQEFVEYQVVDGRVYLPARSVCEKIGLDMSWDKATKTVSVVKDGKSVPMNTRLFDGVSYMGVRDLKELGYDVSYTKADGVHTVSVAA